MRANDLDKRVKLQQMVAGQDAVGQPVQTWTDVATIWANIVHQSGIEAIKHDAVASSVRASIRIRARAGVAPSMRILLGATAYNILAVLPDGSRMVNLACEVVQ